jgi:hypothetical protein
MVLGATGHQRLPPTALAEITRRLRRELTRFPELSGICSLAAGADQLFAKLVLDAGGQLRVIVPSTEYEATFTRQQDKVTYHELLNRASAVEQLEFDQPSEAAFYAAGQRVVDCCQRLIAIWDGQPARGFGGTADVVNYARGRGKAVVVIWPAGVKR